LRKVRVEAGVHYIVIGEPKFHDAVYAVAPASSGFEDGLEHVVLTVSRHAGKPPGNVSMGG
jgi:hypothetical protein